MIALTREPALPKLTHKVCRILSAAWQRAWRQRHDSIDTGHLLLELVRERGAVAASILSDFKVTCWGLRRALPLRAVSPSRPPEAPIAMTATCADVLNIAARDAADLSHPHIGAEHVLLALLQCPGSRATATLEKLNVPATEVSRRLLRLLADEEAYLETAG